MINLKSERLQCEDGDGSSWFIVSLCVCVCVRERNREEDMFYAFVFAHMPPSLRLCVPLAASA